MIVIEFGSAAIKQVVPATKPATNFFFIVFILTFGLVDDIVVTLDYKTITNEVVFV